MAYYGVTFPGMGTVDNQKVVSAGGTWSAGNSTDCRDTTSGYAPLYAVATFKIENNEGSPTEGIDLEVLVQFSDDNTNWPDDGQGHPIFAHVDSDTGSSLTLSRHCEFAVPQRYCRFLYRNNNSSDDLKVTAELGLAYLESTE